MVIKLIFDSIPVFPLKCIAYNVQFQILEDGKNLLKLTFGQHSVKTSQVFE